MSTVLSRRRASLAAATCALTGILLQPGVARAATAVNTAVVGVAAAPDASPSDDRRFDVLEYRVLGNKSLDVATVERAVYAHLGPGLGIADVEAARTSLEQAYRTAGFGTVYVDIPEQDIERGIVRLKVTEGELRRVRIEGARYFSARSIRDALPAATPGRAPSLPELQRQLVSLNSKTADRSVVPVLAAGQEPGTVDLTLKVQDSLPLHASVEVNDQFTADTSRLRTQLSLSYDNVFNRLDTLALQYQTAPQELAEFGVFVASYSTRISEGGTRLAVFLVDSDTDVATVGGLTVLGAGRIYGTRLIAPLVSTQAETHSLTLGADYKDFIERVRLDVDANVDTPISYVNLSLGQSSIWRRGPRTLSLSSTVNLGPRRIGNQDGEFADKRFRGRPNYFFLQADGSVSSTVFGSWIAFARMVGQFAVEPLINNEQFSIGGASGARGYLEAEGLGDLGFKATLELRAPAWRFGADALSLEGFGFTDFAGVSTLQPLPGETSRSDLSSVGLGFNFAAGKHVDGSVSWAYPLVPGPRTPQGDSRLHFSVRSSW